MAKMEKQASVDTSPGRKILKKQRSNWAEFVGSNSAPRFRGTMDDDSEAEVKWARCHLGPYESSWMINSWFRRWSCSHGFSAPAWRLVAAGIWHPVFRGPQTAQTHSESSGGFTAKNHESKPQPKTIEWQHDRKTRQKRSQPSQSVLISTAAVTQWISRSPDSWDGHWDKVYLWLSLVEVFILSKLDNPPV